MPRQLLVGTFFALPGLLVGYILATAWLDQTLARPVDYTTLARLLPDLWAASRPPRRETTARQGNRG